MAYWIYENGETIGPLKAVEVLERAQSGTLVSNGQEWVALREHPDFGFAADDLLAESVSEEESSHPQNSATVIHGADRTPVASNEEHGLNYWIYENSETIGPFSEAEIRSVARNGTLVSHGQGWVRFEYHPDFQSCSLGEPRAAREREIHPTTDVTDEAQFWIWEHGQAIGPLDANEVLARATGKTLVSLGQEWISIAQHPVFCKFASFLPEVNGQSPNDDDNSKAKLDAYEGDEWVAMAESEGHSVNLGTRPLLNKKRNDETDPESEPGVGLPWIVRDYVAESSPVVRLAMILSVVFLLSLVVWSGRKLMSDSVEIPSGTQTQDDQRTDRFQNVQSQNTEVNFRPTPDLGSEIPTSEYGPGQCGENFERVFFAAATVRESFKYIKKVTPPGQPYDLDLYPSEELDLINSLTLSPAVRNFPPDERQVCARLAGAVGQILKNSIGDMYLVTSIELGDASSALVLSGMFLEEGDWVGAYQFGFVGQAADQTVAKALMAQAALHLRPWDLDEYDKNARNYWESYSNLPQVAAPVPTAVSPTLKEAVDPMASSASQPGAVWTEPEIGMRFRYIPAGSFEMGSPATDTSRSDDELQHQVTRTRGFWIGETEVTRGQWRAVMSTIPSESIPCGDSCAVDQVNWLDAVTYANALSQKAHFESCYQFGGESVIFVGLGCEGYRLPTEAEWEFAARAGGSQRYAGGDALSAVGWSVSNSGGRSHPVGQKQPNAWGLHDMSGNVWEWVWDWYGAYPFDSVIDPTGPPTGLKRSARGGSWFDVVRLARSAHRSSIAPGNKMPSVGLRIVRTAQ